MGRYSFGWKKVRQILQKTNGTCLYCGEKLPPDTEIQDDIGNTIMRIRNWDVEHLIPLSRGGSNDINNLAPSCKMCNGKKGIKTSEEFLNEYDI